jgi:hypothetical protein
MEAGTQKNGGVALDSLTQQGKLTRLLRATIVQLERASELSPH